MSPLLTIYWIEPVWLVLIHAERQGVDAMSAVVPFYYKTTVEQIKEHYNAIMAAVPLPMLIYHYPGATGVQLSMDFYEDMARHPQCIGVKFTSLNLFEMQQIRARCGDRFLIFNGHAKVYGKAKVGAPPMSVPHLDTRYIDNKKALLFGPFAGFSPKFLKTGSYFDLIGSVKPNNVLTMLAAGVKEMALTKYLIQQVLLSNEKRMEELREFIPNAKSEDWEIVVAGQRVQVIKDTDAGKGTLQFGTEVVSAADGSVAALLGASPGASTAVHVMLEVLEKCFPQHMKEWEPKIKEMIPSYGVSLVENPELFQEIHTSTAQTLSLSEKELVYS